MKSAMRREKSAIAEYCAQQLPEGSAVYLDNGSTTVEIADALRGKQNIAVLSHSLPVLNILSHAKNIQLISVSGIYEPRAKGFFGDLALRMLRQFRIDIGNIHQCVQTFPRIAGPDLALEIDLHTEGAQDFTPIGLVDVVLDFRIDIQQHLQDGTDKAGTRFVVLRDIQPFQDHIAIQVLGGGRHFHDGLLVSAAGTTVMPFMNGIPICPDTIQEKQNHEGNQEERGKDGTESDHRRVFCQAVIEKHYVILPISKTA